MDALVEGPFKTAKGQRTQILPGVLRKSMGKDAGGGTGRTDATQAGAVPGGPLASAPKAPDSLKKLDRYAARAMPATSASLRALSGASSSVARPKPNCSWITSAATYVYPDMKSAANGVAK